MNGNSPTPLPATPTDWTRQSASQIAACVAKGELSAAETVEAHIRRIEAVNERLDAVVVKCYDRARREANDIDRRRARGEPLGPLAGVPVTIKECFHVAGTPSTMGVGRFVGRAGRQRQPAGARAGNAPVPSCSARPTCRN